MTHAIEHIGLIVIFGIVFLPVYLMIAGWIFGKPRQHRTVGLAFGYILAYTVAIVVSLGIVGGLIQVIVSL